MGSGEGRRHHYLARAAPRYRRLAQVAPRCCGFAQAALRHHDPMRVTPTYCGLVWVAR
jgi:hypothetical protein